MRVHFEVDEKDADMLYSAKADQRRLNIFVTQSLGLPFLFNENTELCVE